jgi:hypothetical protein
MFTRKSTAPFISPFFIRKAKRLLMSAIAVLPSGCVMFYYMSDAQIFFSLST